MKTREQIQDALDATALEKFDNDKRISELLRIKPRAAEVFAINEYASAAAELHELTERNHVLHHRFLNLRWALEEERDLD